MYQERNCIEEQSFFLDLNVKDRHIRGHTKVKLKLENLALPENGHFTINLCAKQLDVKSVDILTFSFQKEGEESLKDVEDKKLVKLTWSYPGISVQANQMEQLTNNMRSLDMWSRVMRTNAGFQNKGLLEMNFELPENVEKADIPKIKVIELTLLIKYEVSKPAAGFKFHQFESEGKQRTCVYNENKLGYTRYWLPCLDDVKQKTYLKTVKIAVPSNYIAICSGTLVQQIVEESNFRTIYEYDVSNKIHINNYGICVGEFKTEILQVESSAVYCFYMNNIKEEINKTFQDGQLLQKTRDFFKGYLGLDIFQNFKLIIIPNIVSSIKSLEIPTSFFDMIVIEESLLLKARVLENQSFRKVLIFKSFCWSGLSEMNLFSVSEFWIKVGVHGFLGDIFFSFVANEIEYKIFIQRKFEQMLDFIQNGRELYSVGNPQFTHEAEMYVNEAYILKSCIVFHMLTNLINFDNAKRLIKLLVENDRVINNENFFKMIKTNFGIKKLKYFKKQFVKRTGCPIFECDYNYSRKENKIDIKMTQQCLQEEYYKEFTENRLHLENTFGIENEMVNILNKLPGDNSNLAERHQFVNKKTESCKIFWGNINVVASETNEIEFREEIHPVKIEEKKSIKLTITCKSRLRKTIQKKYDYDDDNESLMEKSMGASSYHDNTKKISILNLTSGSRNPALWIKLDPDNRYLKSVKINQSENIWLLQFNQETELAGKYAALKALKNFPTLSVASTLCSFLDNRDLDYRLKILIIDVLLTLNPETTGSRGVDNLYNFATKIKVDIDNSLKSNDFSQKGDYFMLKKIIKKLCLLREKLRIPNQSHNNEECFTDLNHIKLFLRFVKENDNSNNEFDDSYYIANLIGSLLSVKNPYFVKKILKEALRFLQLELVMPSYQNVVALKILKKYNTFCANHNLLPKRRIEEEKIVKLLDSIKNALEKFKAKFSSDSRIICAFLYHKIEKMFLKKKKIWDILIFALKYIETFKLEQKFIAAENLLCTLYEFVCKHKKHFYHMQSLLTLEGNKKVVDILWEVLNQPFSSVSIKFRHYAYLIYREIYYEMLPVCYVKEFSEKMEYDIGWMDFESQAKQMKETNKETKLLSFNKLVLNKRKRLSAEKTKVNPRDLLRAHFRTNPDSQLDWKKLARQILTILMSEKTTDEIEEKLNEEVNTTENEESGTIMIRIKNTTNMKAIKKQLSKGTSYQSIEEVENEVNGVIQSYYKKNLIDEETKEEYDLLISNLFKEANNMLRDYTQRQADKIKSFKIVYKGDS